MKIFGRDDIYAIILIAFISMVVAMVWLDRIPNGTGTVVQENCNFFKVGTNFEPCERFTVKTTDYGAPFVATQNVNKNPVKYRGIPIGKNDVYASFNAVTAFVLLLTLYALSRKYIFSRHFGADLPIVMSSDMFENDGLTSMHQGTMAGFTYNMLSNSSGRVMLHVLLPHKTDTHILAIGSGSQGSVPFTRSMENRLLRQVELEGDFPSHFKIYCTPGKHIELLRLLDPKTMADLVDFCRTYQFEIYEDMLYTAVAEDAADKNDPTTLVEDTEKLLKKHARFFNSF